MTEKLRKAEIIIDVQKKVAALLGHPISEADPGVKRYFDLNANDEATPELAG